MTIMIPAEPRVSTQSEVDVFHAIRTGLGDEWTAIHSLGMAVHPKKPWTEIDFVLIGPPGVFCIEVKGGVEIVRRGMRWEYRDRSGRVVTRGESPFEQVGGATAALRSYLVEADYTFSPTLIGWGVATPYIDFTMKGPGIVPEVIYDADDVQTPFSTYVDRSIDHWISRLGGMEKRGLNEGERQRLIRLLAGDFELVRGLVGRIGDVDRTLVRLTDQQNEVLQGIENDRILVRGGAGTGKTLLALKAAIASARSGRQTMLTCYSRRLGDWLAGQAQDVDGLRVVSLHKFMHDTLEATGRLDELPPADEDFLMQVEYPRQCMEAMLDLELTGSIEQLIVDEAQDLLIPGYLDVFDQLLDGGLGSGRWTAYYDPNQDLFGKLAGQGMDRLQAAGPVRYRLTVNCRNTRQIAFEAGMLARFEPNETLEADGPDVEELWYRDSPDQRRVVGKAIARLLSQGVEPSQIVVLSPRRLHLSALGESLHDVPYPLSEQSDPSDRAIGFSTIQGFKGLESDVVVLVDIDGITGPEDRYRIYVATTRARAHLLVALPETLRPDHQEAAELFGKRLAASLGDRS